MCPSFSIFQDIATTAIGRSESICHWLVGAPWSLYAVILQLLLLVGECVLWILYASSSHLQFDFIPNTVLLKVLSAGYVLNAYFVCDSTAVSLCYWLVGWCPKFSILFHDSTAIGRLVGVP